MYTGATAQQAVLPINLPIVSFDPESSVGKLRAEKSGDVLFQSFAFENFA
jgi:hypothetical protein